MNDLFFIYYIKMCLKHYCKTEDRNSICITHFDYEEHVVYLIFFQFFCLDQCQDVPSVFPVA